ncbi:MAG: ATP-binding protein [Chitinophagaceae bacterium]
MRFFLIATFFFSPFSTLAGVDTTFLKQLYDRCLELNESKADSVCYYASLIENEATRLSFNKGTVLSLRLKGLCNEFRSDYEGAINFYLRSLEEARRIGIKAYEISALSDLGLSYVSLQRPLEAKKFFLSCANLALQSREISSVLTSYDNLGAIYSQLGQYDSALIFLEEALLIGREAGSLIDTSGTYNNIGSIYFKQKKFSLALEYFSKNYANHRLQEDQHAQLWIDHINLADVYTELKRFDSADFHASKAMELVVEMGSKTKEADTYLMLARLNEHRGNFANAYQYLTKWHALDTSLVNDKIQKTISELQERFHAKERDIDNILLTESIEKARYRNRSMFYLVIALAIIGILIATGFFIKRNANLRLSKTSEVIKLKNRRLAEINEEKNSLIGIVSHDLAMPFATINMWGSLLENDSNALSNEQQKALMRIKQAGAYGQEMIQRILDVEKLDKGNYSFQPEDFDLVFFIKSIIEDFLPEAVKKSIIMRINFPEKAITILSDKQLLRRMLENLISNALKYSPLNSTVWIEIDEQTDAVQLKIRDEGVGISREELPRIFSKYSNISSKTTAGEKSIGLGLFIVKGIVERLNGNIYCDSDEGKGTSFTVLLKK